MNALHGSPILRPTSAVSECRVSIIIKALNEEQRICDTVESALRAVAVVGGEVILADSCSTDRTVALARTYPIQIVQLAYPDDRCCGVGPQLGYQHSRGEFVYILDGDMQLLAGFLPKALAFMMKRPTVAGVGGRIVEKNTESLEYISRAHRIWSSSVPCRVDRLDGGGLYRRSAIEAAGYFSDRNLHSYEELDLATRLLALRWELWRLPTDVADHFGHDAPPYQLLMRRWRSGYILGLGELVRAAWGQDRLVRVFGLHELRLYVAVISWWLILVSVPFWSLTVTERIACFLVLLVAPLLVMTWRKRSLTKACYSLISWCFNAAGMVRGLMRPRRPVQEAIASRILQQPTHLPATFALRTQKMRVASV